MEFFCKCCHEELNFLQIEDDVYVEPCVFCMESYIDAGYSLCLERNDIIETY